jgi:AcrR family transcriptional regulator
MPTRSYTLKRRAEQQAETRRRIVEAIVALHREVGPARTTITAIAERAGVERLTVHRHFADEGAMFHACSAHFVAEVPPPRPEAWSGLEEPAARVRGALLAFYDYYRRGERMLAHIVQDAPHIPALTAVLAPWRASEAALREDLLERWGARGTARARLAAALAHAFRFESWRSLARDEGLGDAAVADLMMGLVQAAAAAAGDRAKVAASTRKRSGPRR